MNTQKKLLGFKNEATPGTPETITASDVLVKLRTGSAFSLDVETFETDEVNASSSPAPLDIGRTLVNVPVSYFVRGSGTPETAPAFDPLWKGAVLQSTVLKKFDIDTIAGGPIKAGKIITGDTSGATGMVMRQLGADGTLTVWPLTGSFQNGESFTQEGGATADIASAPADGGYGWRPTDIGEVGGLAAAGHHSTAKVFLDGMQVTAKGVLGDLQIEFAPCRGAIATHNFRGPLSAQGDEALPSPVSFSEQVAPELCDAGLVFDAFKPSGIGEFTLNWPITLSEESDANAPETNGECNCVITTDYERDAPTLTISPRLVLPSTFDFLGKYRDGSTFYLEWTLGKTAGNRFTFVAPEAQFAELQQGERGQSVATADVTIRLTGANDNELLIYQD